MEANTIHPRLRRLLRLLIHPAASCAYLALLLLPLLLAGRYNHPSNDDYSNSIWTDFWAYQHELYFFWTGRFFSSAVLSLNPLHWRSFEGYRIAAYLLITGFAMTYTATICAMLRLIGGIAFRIRLFIGVVASGLILNGVNSLSEAFYWYTGSMSYTLPVVLLCWAALQGMRIHQRVPRRLPVVWIKQALLIIAATGCNEVSLSLPGLACAALFLYYRRHGDRRLSRHYAAMLAPWILSAAVAIAAPGNFERLAVTKRNMLVAIPSWPYFTKEFFLEWILEPVFLTISVALMYCSSLIAVRSTLSLSRVFLVSLGIILITLLPSFWAFGQMPPYRVRNLCYMAFVPGWILVLISFGQRFRMLGLRFPEASALLRAPLAIFCSIFLLAQLRIETLRGSSNYLLLLKDFRKNILVNYDAEHCARYAMIRQSESDTVWIPRLQYKQSNMVHFADIGADPTNFPNTSVAKFWGKKLIGLQTDTPARKQNP